MKAVERETLWQGRVQQWRSSGLSQRAYALQQGYPVRQMGYWVRRIARMTAASVMQDDHLFTGSLQIFDNIALLDPNSDLRWVVECAKSAALHEEINTMPMGYHTLIGDMGTSLDLQNEMKIDVVLANLGITRVIVAHRPQTISAAKRVLLVENGRVIEVNSPAIDAPPILERTPA